MVIESINPERSRSLELAISQIKKNFGKGSIMRLGDNDVRRDIETVSTGSIELDKALGIGGLPKGRIIEIFGPESSGKTTLALHTVANIQKEGGKAVYIDAEHAFDPIYAKNLGINTDELIVSQPSTGEEALQISEILIRSSAVDIVVIDSVAALVPEAELKGDIGDNFIGLQARLMSQALRKLTGIISKTNCIAIFINQIREKVGVLFGNPETTSGGKALKFYASVRLDIRKKNVLKVKDEYIGNRVCVKVVKNKIAPPFKKAEFDIIFGKGISVNNEIIDIALRENIIGKNGIWFYYNNIRLGQGREAAILFLDENKEIFDEIKNKILMEK